MASLACKFDHSPVTRKKEANVSPSRLPLVGRASEEEKGDILKALSTPSLTNVIMKGFIRDNGLTNPQNRGQFYTCRNKQDELEGIALIGHTILFEAMNEAALETFAMLARSETSSHLLMGEHGAVQRFWNYYAHEKQSPRLVCPVLVLRRTEPFEGQPQVSGLRLATREDLEHVVWAQAAMALETSGVDPLKKDAIGFRERYLRRIDKKRVWVLMKNGRLVFKTDVIAEIPEATYIEGVYVSPDERGKGVGRSCLSGLGRIFLERTKAIYLFIEQENSQTKSFYSNLGFSVADHYALLYF
jgi:predicted GNAT family acetyltransferase